MDAVHYRASRLRRYSNVAKTFFRGDYMFGGSKQEQLEHRLDHKLNASSDGIDMD